MAAIVMHDKDIVTDLYALLNFELSWWRVLCATHLQDAGVAASQSVAGQCPHLDNLRVIVTWTM